MMGFDLAALLGLFGLSGFFALIGLVLAAWMAWRIVEKAGLPGWLGLGSILLTLTAVGTIVPLILLWVFAFMRWPRDEEAPLVALPGQPTAAPPQPGAQPGMLPPPPKALGDRRPWRLSGLLPTGGTVAIAIDGTVPAYLLTGAAAAQANELSVPDPSVGQPHARLLVAGGRLGLEDLGTRGGTLIDGARLLPEHGPRDISAARTIRLGSVELALARS
jgi:FHA domain-containing protein